MNSHFPASSEQRNKSAEYASVPITVSVIIPVYNEEQNIELMYSRLARLFSDELSQYALELIFSDNASTDETFTQIKSLSARDSRVKGIRLSRNFGFQANILSGLVNATGSAVIQIDADGEDPPEVIPAFIEKWEDGYEVVYGIRACRKESFWLTLQRKCFYRLLKFIANVSIPLDAGDFRLLDRRVVDVIRHRFEERNPYLRGLISYAGFKQIGIPYNRAARTWGTSKFNFFSYFALSLDAITSFSRIPLKLMSILGLLLSVLSFIGIISYLVLYLLGKIPVPGFATLVMVVLFGSGIQLLSLGLMGEYIGRIFDEVKRRPRTIVSDYCGFAELPKEA